MPPVGTLRTVSKREVKTPCSLEKVDVGVESQGALFSKSLLQLLFVDEAFEAMTAVARLASMVLLTSRKTFLNACKALKFVEASASQQEHEFLRASCLFLNRLNLS